MSRQSKRREALVYHAKPKPGKLEVNPSKPYTTQRDLSLAYSPGVAEPCLEIEKATENVYKYTNKANLVAVISNGTAVLGLVTSAHFSTEIGAFCPNVRHGFCDPKRCQIDASHF